MDLQEIRDNLAMFVLPKKGFSSNMCQSTNVASLASMVQGNLTIAEKRTESARTESIDYVEVDDLENLVTPEMIMLSAVCGEGSQDRS